MEGEQKSKPIHVVMFPFLAFGHMLPFLELSRSLQIHGLKISFLSTPLNIRRLKAHLQAENENEQQIKWVELEMPPMDGLSPCAESTADISTDQIPFLHEALQRLEHPVAELLQHLSPDYVIFDLAQHWICNLATKFGITPIPFFVFGAASTGYLMAPDRRDYQRITPQDLTLQPLGFPPSAVSLQLFEARNISVLYTGDIEAIKCGFRCIDGSSAIAVRSCFELEGKFLEYLQMATGKLLLPVGALVPDTPAKQPSDSACLRWLDQQSPSSVVFVSFGSECSLTEDQIHQLALGLEEAHLPFLCVLRFPKHGVTHPLPDGFESRTRDRGCVVVGEWVPQLHVLSHPATGGFLTHCGWSSVLEGMRFGVPLIPLPMQFEQGIYARQVVHEWKVGVEVHRATDGSFRKDDIRKAVRTVMVEEEGKQVRMKAKELSATVLGKDGFQQTYIQHFIQNLQQLRSQPNR